MREHLPEPSALGGDRLCEADVKPHGRGRVIAGRTVLTGRARAVNRLDAVLALAPDRVEVAGVALDVVLAKGLDAYAGASGFRALD